MYNKGYGKKRKQNMTFSFKCSFSYSSFIYIPYREMNQGGFHMLASIPLWVYIVIGFIFFSGYMAFRAMKAEYELEQQFIEKEGEVYIERIEKARKEKREKEKMRN